MTLKDRLLVATKKAAEAYNLGATPSAAVIKAAKDYGFNKDQTERLVEMFNTALTLHNFNKNASDRTGDFDLADKVDVIHGLYEEKPREKVKAAFDYSFYDGPARNLVKAAHVPTVQLEKAAEVHEDTELTPGQVVRYATMAKQAVEMADDALGAIQDTITSELYKLAGAIQRSYDPEEKCRKLKYAASDCPKLIEMMDSVLPKHLKDIMGYGENDLVDMDDVAPEKGMLDHIKQLMKDHGDIQITRISFKKKAETLWDKIVTPHVHETDVFDKITEKAAGLTDFAAKVLPPVLSEEDATSLEELAAEKNKADQEEQARIGENTERQALITDLMTTDPIISEADPQDVVQMYATIVNIAPRVANQKEIVRSMLRQAVNSVALSPFDAKTYVDLNSALSGKTTRTVA